LKQHPPWSCYPQGIEPARRSFLKVLATAAASTLACGEEATGGQKVAERSTPPEDVPGDFPEGAVRLNFNENPLGPSPKAIAAIRTNGLADSQRYNNIFPLADSLAQHHGISNQEILLGCGSTEFLHIAPWTFLREGHQLVLPDPSYGWSAGVATSMGANVVRVPVDPEGSIDTPALKKAIDADTRLVYIANPNNPTGAHMTFDEISTLVEALPDQAVLFVDEAYNPFLAEGTSAIKLVRQGAPVIVSRTFSKAYGLAGLRLGYAMAPETLIEKLETFWMLDLGINAAVNIAAPAALADDDHVNRYVSMVDQGLDKLRSGLAALGLAPYKHRAPFLMVDLGREATPVVKALEAKKVYVRDGRAWKTPTFIRISVGTVTENDAFLEALPQVL
jgi:histidinol-phosphate aminotransferase